MGNEVALIPYEQIEKMSRVITLSGLFGVNKPEQAMALMLVAQAEGMHPVTAARDYHIIQGKPTLKVDALLSRFIKAGGKIVYNKYTDQSVSVTASHPECGELTVDWDIARARQAGIANKDIWKSYPRNMLRARAVSEAIHAIAPWVAVGVLTKEEAEDIPETPQIVNPSQQQENSQVQAAPVETKRKRTVKETTAEVIETKTAEPAAEPEQTAPAPEPEKPAIELPKNVKKVQLFPSSEE